MRNVVEVSQYDELIELAEKRQERISSTTDLTINRKLFGILKKAADALEGVEERTTKIGEMEKELKQEQESKMSLGFVGIVMFCLVAVISLGFAYSVHFGNGSAKKILEYVVVNGTSEEDREKAKRVLDERPYDDYSHSAAFWYGDDLIKEYKKQAIPIRCFIGSLKGWFFISIALAVLYYIWGDWLIKRHLDKYVPEQKRKIDEATSELQTYIEDNEEILRLVPSACKSSKQLYRVVTLYESGKADNLKESLNLADTGEYRDFMVANVYQLSQSMAAILGQLNKIVGYMEDSVWY